MDIVINILTKIELQLPTTRFKQIYDIPLLYLIIEKPSVELYPSILIERDTAVFRCQGKYGGPRGDQNISANLYMNMFHSNNQGKKVLPAIDMTAWENNTLLKVCQLACNVPVLYM